MRDYLPGALKAVELLPEPSQIGRVGRIVDEVAALIGILAEIEQLLGPWPFEAAEVLQVVDFDHLPRPVQIVVHLAVNLIRPAVILALHQRYQRAAIQPVRYRHID